MSHHRDGMSDEFKRLAHELSLGPTNKFPAGKINTQDQGEIKIAIGHSAGRVIVNFGDKPVTWVGFEAKQARDIAASLIAQADEVDK